MLVAYLIFWYLLLYIYCYIVFYLPLSFSLWTYEQHSKGHKFQILVLQLCVILLFNTVVEASGRFISLHFELSCKSHKHSKKVNMPDACFVYCFLTLFVTVIETCFTLKGIYLEYFVRYGHRNL